MPSLLQENLFISGIPLSRFTASITKAVNSSPDLFGAWIIAELSDVRVAGGHCYMELIEKNDSGQTIAKLRATVWQSTFSQLRRKFYQASGRDIVTGLKVLIKGNATHHSIYGLSFNITDIDPSYTLGDMERLRREILMKLQKEGIADNNKRRELPLAPQRIAVISAQGAAGYGDFINQLIGNREGFVFYPCLFPCVMQGDRVPDSIMEAISFIESTADLWDCIAIVRGGGATTDLNGFDNYDLAKAVAICGLPVVVGIGHERDRNVLDEIAHTSLKTPTAVASFFIDKLRDAYERTIYLGDMLRQSVNLKIRGEEMRLSSIEGVIPQLALRRLEDSKGNLIRISHTLPLVMDGRIAKEKERIYSSVRLIENLGNNLVSRNILKIKELIQHLSFSSGKNISSASLKLQNMENLLKVLDPSNTLKRGYSITRFNGQAIKDVKGLKKGDLVTTTLFTGEFDSIVD